MRRLIVPLAVAWVLTVPALAAAMTLSLADGTVTANRQDAGTYGDWFGESVTALTIDARNVGTGNYVVVSGKITGLSNQDTSWAEIGLIPKATWDQWQTAYGGAYKSAVYNKGIYAVHWSSGGLGLSLEENGPLTGEPFAWPLATPSSSSPWDFTFTMYPTGGGGGAGGSAYLSVEGATLYGSPSLAYTGDYSECYLFARIWSSSQNATVSFEDVHATAVPEPLTMLGMFLGLGSVGAYIRKRRTR